MAGSKHIPMRTCVSCRKRQAKSAMIRVVRTQSALMRDDKKSMAGRGQYLCSEDCYNKLTSRSTKKIQKINGKKQ